MDPSLLALVGGTPNGVEPFKVKWQRQDGGGFETEAVAVGGKYRPFAAPPSTLGQARIYEVQQQASAAFAQYNPGTTTKLVASFDLTDTFRAFVYGVGTNDYLAEGRFRHDYT